jgi:hypothetical protein
MEAELPFDPRLMSALLGAAIVGLGWAVSEWRGRIADRRRREERTRDVQTAIAAEILPNIEALRLFDLEADLNAVVDRMREDENFVPLVPKERNDTLFRAIIGEIHVLPEEVIRPVVRYYSQLFALEAMIEDLRSDGIESLAVERREAMYADYISVKIQALKFGESALNAIETALKEKS